MTNTVLATEAARNRVLVAIKVAHTAIWAFFVTCILAIPLAGWRGQFELAWILTGVVLVECAVLVLNRGVCPLTPMASRFTAERHPAFDIYLPGWVARWNKALFGSIFVAGEIFVLWLRFLR